MATKQSKDSNSKKNTSEGNNKKPKRRFVFHVIKPGEDTIDIEQKLREKYGISDEMSDEEQVELDELASSMLTSDKKRTNSQPTSKSKKSGFMAKLAERFWG